jgi:NAD(P)-dependent dehydrogenase (short-subunit alcohol dehydrogenase family)
MDLEGKHVVIIGGSSGMGLATAVGAAAAADPPFMVAPRTPRRWRARLRS